MSQTKRKTKTNFYKLYLEILCAPECDIILAIEISDVTEILEDESVKCGYETFSFTTFHKNEYELLKALIVATRGLLTEYLENNTRNFETKETTFYIDGIANNDFVNEYPQLFI